MILSTSSLTGVTAKPSIVEDIDFLVNTTSTTYPLADKLRNINAHYYDVITLILASQSNWEWDDTNKTDFPIGTTTLVDSQRDYSLPTDLIKLLRVEVLTASGDYRKLNEIDESQIQLGLTNFLPTAGLPLWYREIGTSIELYPKPSATSVTTALGLKVYFQRLSTLLTTSDAATSPGFDATYHRILSYGAAYDYALAKGLDQANGLFQKMEALKLKLVEGYAKRNREVRPKLRAKPQQYE